VKFCPVSE